jgi:hypothetical protein
LTQDQLELGQRQLAQTQREIELSRTQVEQAHRPVLVPIVLPRLRSNRALHLPGESEFVGPGRPGVTEPGVLAVQVVNVGSGAALRVAASIEQLDKHGDRYTSAGPLQPPSEMTAIGKDDPVSIDIHYPDWDEHWDFQLA